MKKFINIATALSLAAAMASCSMTENTPARHDLQDKQRLHDIRNNLPETIRIFDPGEFFPTDTKSDLGLPVDIQSDALDYDNASALSNSLYDYVQIPVNAITPLTYTTVRLPGFKDGIYPSKTAHSKVFLVVQFPKDSAEKERIGIVTIVPHPDFMTREQLDSLDFLYNGHFNAVFLYADIYGNFKKAEIYIQGLKYRDCIIARQMDGDTAEAVLTPVTESCSDVDGVPVRTSDDDYYVLPEVICVGYTDDWMTWPNEDEDHISNSHNHFNNDKDDSPDHPVGGGGGGKRRQICKVLIAKEGRGEVSGEGEYTAYEAVTCTASPHMVGDIQTSEFIQWTGDITSSSQTITFSVGDYLLRGQVSLTAVFHDLNPCADEESDRRDPLREMKIQASGAGGWNIKGGTFGWTRNGGATEHRGMDFACPEGTPVHATHSGKISAIRNDVLASDESFKDYQERGGKDCTKERFFNAGNAIEIECYTNGGLYTIKYYHLTSVADGLLVDNYVEAGDIIGYSGITGNGGSKSSGGPHLHYQVNIGRSMNDRTNPEPFIYSKFDDKGIQTNPCDD